MSAVGEPGSGVGVCQHKRQVLHPLATVCTNVAGYAGMETFRAIRVIYSKEPFEGHTMLPIEGSWNAQRPRVRARSLFVPIAQPNARLVVALLDPQGGGLVCRLGVFDMAFEAKEYMEPYVTEQVGARSCGRPGFQEAACGGSAVLRPVRARLEYFYRRSPSWDERLNLYPVYRVDVAP